MIHDYNLRDNLFSFFLWQKLKIEALANIWNLVAHYSGGMVIICN